MKGCSILGKEKNLTFFGKVTVIKSLALSNLTYNACIIDVPDGVICKVNWLAYDFLWNGKTEKIKRKTLIGKLTKGGISMPDFSLHVKALKITWAKKYCVENT